MRKPTKDWGKRAVLVFAVCLYLITFIIAPAKAEASLIYGLKEIRKLFIPLFVAIFVGATIKNLITPRLISKVFDGRKGLFTAGVVGSILPPCPYISYPAIKGFNDSGVALPATMVMLITATTVEVGQLFCGLAVFGPEIVGLRISFSFLSAMIVGTLYFFLRTRSEGRLYSREHFREESFIPQVPRLNVRTSCYNNYAVPNYCDDILLSSRKNLEQARIGKGEFSVARSQIPISHPANWQN